MTNEEEHKLFYCNFIIIKLCGIYKQYKIMYNIKSIMYSIKSYNIYIYIFM